MAKLTRYIEAQNAWFSLGEMLRQVEYLVKLGILVTSKFIMSTLNYITFCSTASRVPDKVVQCFIASLKAGFLSLTAFDKTMTVQFKHEKRTIWTCSVS